MGGDRGPEEVVAGAFEAATDGIVSVVYGPTSLDAGGLEHVVAEQVIAMDEKPAEAVRAKPDSSLVAANTESRELLAKAADVVVTDGFTGNVALKALEGTIRTVIEGLRTEITSTGLGKLGGLLIRPASRRLRRRLDPDTYGGAYLLGLRGVVVIAHGNSSRRAIANAIRLAARGVEHDVVGRLAERVSGRLESSRSSTGM